MSILAPSILSADFARLEEDVKATERGGARLLHIDVMDGHFVPNISFGADVMKCLLGKASLPFDVHLMIEDADRYLEDFITENTAYITVHQEASTHLDRTLKHIKDVGARAGVAINPATPLSTLECVMGDVDLILIMTVNPGFGGQHLIPGALDKVRELKKIREEKNLDFMIEVDGGANVENARQIIEAGTDILVAGSAIFRADDIEEKTKEFVDIIG